jgi:acyl carrier protein
LRLEQVGIDDNFFALGGHSLLATQIIARVCDTFHAKVPLRTLFEAPTVADLGLVIAEYHARRIALSDVEHLWAKDPALGDEPAQHHRSAAADSEP